MLILVAGSACQTAQAAPVDNSIDEIKVLAEQYKDSDSLKVTLTWSIISDGNGPIDSFRVVLVGGQDTTVRVTSPIYSFIAYTNPGIQYKLHVDIWSIRRNKESIKPRSLDWVFIPPDIPPPIPDTIHVDTSSFIIDSVLDSIPSFGFVTPRLTSPHYDHIRRTFTDFCYCWTDTKKAWAAAHYDLAMSGDVESWKKYNPSITFLRYILLGSTLDEANTDPNSITGKFQADMRQWFASSLTYDYESAWLHNKDSIQSDSAARLHPHIWSTNRFFGNPLDVGWIAYTEDRFRRALNGDGFFIDEMDGPNLKYLASSKEGQTLDTLQWQNAIITQVKQLRAAFPGKMIQINAAGYSNKDFEKRIGIAAGSMHLELMNLATQTQPDKWNLIDLLLAHNTYVDFVGAETWQDMLNPKWITKYPGGNYGLPVYRAKIAQLASYYMVVPSDPQKLGLQIENTRGISPDSTNLKIYDYDVGHPIESRHVVYSGKDALGQNAKVYVRNFENATVIYRPVVYWSDTLFTNNTAITVPDSITASRWYINARGQFTPFDSLQLRNSEAAILVKRRDN